MSHDPPVIEHDSDEPPPDRSGNTVYWANLILLILLWTWLLFSEPINWICVAIGAWTGTFIAIWSIDKTRNKPPKWMRR